jgi:hypothetical protein
LRPRRRDLHVGAVPKLFRVRRPRPARVQPSALVCCWRVWVLAGVPGQVLPLQDALGGDAVAHQVGRQLVRDLVRGPRSRTRHRLGDVAGSVARPWHVPERCAWGLSAGDVGLERHVGAEARVGELGRLRLVHGLTIDGDDAADAEFKPPLVFSCQGDL